MVKDFPRTTTEKQNHRLYNTSLGLEMVAVFGRVVRYLGFLKIAGKTA